MFRSAPPTTRPDLGALPPSQRHGAEVAAVTRLADTARRTPSPGAMTATAGFLTFATIVALGFIGFFPGWIGAALVIPLAVLVRITTITRTWLDNHIPAVIGWCADRSAWLESRSAVHSIVPLPFAGRVHPWWPIDAARTAACRALARAIPTDVAIIGTGIGLTFLYGDLHWAVWCALESVVLVAFVLVDRLPYLRRAYRAYHAAIQLVHAQRCARSWAIR